MDYLTVKEAGEKWSITSRMVALYCVAGRIEGAVKKGNFMARAKDRAKTKQRQAKKENLLICRRGAELDESLYGKSHKLAAPKIGRYIMK